MKLNSPTLSLDPRFSKCLHVCLRTSIQFKLLSFRWNTVKQKMTWCFIVRCQFTNFESEEIPWAMLWNRMKITHAINSISKFCETTVQLKHGLWWTYLITFLFEHVFIHLKPYSSRFHQTPLPFSLGAVCKPNRLWESVYLYGIYH